METIDGLAIRTLEGDMSAAHRVAPADSEVEALLAGEVRQRPRFLVDDAVAQPPEHFLVEALRALPLADVDRDVRDGHWGVWQTASMLLPSASWTNAA